MTPATWVRVFGVLGADVVESEAYEVPGGWIVRRCGQRAFVECEKLSTNRADAEARLRALEVNDGSQ